MTELLRLMCIHVGLDDCLIERIREQVFGDRKETGTLKQAYDWGKEHLRNERDANMFSASFAKFFYERNHTENERLMFLTNILLQLTRVSGLGFYSDQLAILSAYINESNEKVRAKLKFVNRLNGDETEFESPDEAIEFFSNLLDNSHDITVSYSMRTRNEFPSF